MQKTLSLAIGISLLFTLSACQPKSEAPTVEAIDSSAQPQSSVEKSPKPIATDNAAIDAKTCLALNKSMQKTGDSSKIEDIDAIQKQLKTCLPTANNSEALKLLKNYQAMYKRFLGTDIYMDDAQFYAIVEAIEAGKEIPDEPFKALSPRIQYLTKLAESQADVSILYIGEGIFVFHHDLAAMAALFSPYLPKDQRAFIQRMAKDNQDIFWNDAAINIPFEAVMERAVFWEDYIKRYPNSYFSQDAKNLLGFYRHALFFGSENTQWTDDAVKEFIDPNYKQLISKLAKRSDSILAKDAQTFLSFLALSDSERQQTLMAPIFDEDGYEIQEWSKVRYQLQSALAIPSPWEARHYPDCMNGVVCIDKIDFDSLDVSPAFAAACASAYPDFMEIKDDVKVWGFDTDVSDKDAQCEVLNLKDYAEFDCQIEMDLNKNPYIGIYNDSGWYKRLYESSDDCALALKDFTAADDNNE